MCNGINIFTGDAEEVLKTMPDGSFDCCVTSPPYWGLRDYGCDGQIGLESSPDEYVSRIVRVFQEVRRVLRDDGTLWLNIGDCYANDDKWGGRTSEKHVRALHGEPIGRGRRYTGLKPKDLVGIPWMVAFALRADGWYLRSDIIWAKRNCLPESVTDRPTKSHEHIFLLAKSRHYYYDADAIREPLACGDKQVGPHSSFLTDKSPRPRKRLPSQVPEGMALAKWGGEHPQSASRKIIENVKRARANGGDHNSPFGQSRNKRDVWHVATHAFPGAHFATFPPDLVVPCVLAGCRPGGVVLDPFAGSGTVGVVALQNGRGFVGVDVNEKYFELMKKRFENVRIG